MRDVTPRVTGPAVGRRSHRRCPRTLTTNLDREIKVVTAAAKNATTAASLTEIEIVALANLMGAGAMFGH